MSNGSVGCSCATPRLERHLEQHVPQLLGHVLPIAPLDRLAGLVSLLLDVLHQGLVGLLGVPRAARAHRSDAPGTIWFMPA